MMKSRITTDYEAPKRLVKLRGKMVIKGILWKKQNTVHSQSHL